MTSFSRSRRSPRRPDRSPDRRPGRRPGLWLALPALVLLALALVSPYAGRATPVGSYRPPLPPDALTNGCWPLPGGARLDLAYQVRGDELVATPTGVVRRLVLHYDRVGAVEARRRIVSSLRRAGSRPLAVAVTPFDGSFGRPGSLVRGVAVVDLPPSAPDTTREVCRSPYVTKRFVTQDAAS